MKHAITAFAAVCCGLILGCAVVPAVERGGGGRSYGRIPGGLPTILVPNVAALRAFDPGGLPAGTRASINGCFADNDGGGGDFIFEPGSSDRDDTGDVIAPDSGKGRWLRVFEGDVNIRWFGARGDGKADDAGPLQAAIDASLRRGCGVHVPAGRFHIRRGLTALGSLRIHGDGCSSILDGAGVNCWNGDPAKDLGLGVTVDCRLGTKAYAAVGRLSGGTNSLTLNSVEGLSQGSEVYLELGTAASDSTQPFFRMFARIAAIRGKTILLDHAVPEDIHGVSHKVWPNLSPARNVEITSLRSDHFTFSLNHIEGGNVSDIHFDATNWCFLVTDSFNLTIQRIDVDVLQGVPSVGPALMEGWVIAGWGMYGLNVRDVRVRDLRGVQFFSSEAESRLVFMDNIDLGLDDAPGNKAEVPEFIASGSASPRPIQVRNLHLEVLAGSRRFNLADANVRYENVYIDGNRSSDSAHPAPPDVLLPLSNLSGSLYFKNSLYSVRKSFRRIIRVAPGRRTVEYDLGVRGLLSQVRIYANNLKGITAVYHGSENTVTGINLLPRLAPGRFSPLLPEATWIGVGDANYHTDRRTLMTVCDGNQGSVTFLFVEGEVLVSPTEPEVNPSD
jgi:hypothetical protein